MVIVFFKTLPRTVVSWSHKFLQKARGREEERFTPAPGDLSQGSGGEPPFPTPSLPSFLDALKLGARFCDVVAGRCVRMNALFLRLPLCPPDSVPDNDRPGNFITLTILTRVSLLYFEKALARCPPLPSRR